MTTVRSAIVREAVREEAELWRIALREVRCILPDDAEDVEKTVKALRRVKDVGISGARAGEALRKEKGTG